jgi:hypothetical protein
VAERLKRNRPSLSLTLGLIGSAALVSVLLGLDSAEITFYEVSSVVVCALFAASNTVFWLARTSPAFTLRVQAIEIALIGLFSAAVSPPEPFGGILVFAVAVPLLAKSGLVESAWWLIPYSHGSSILHRCEWSLATFRSHLECYRC